MSIPENRRDLRFASGVVLFAYVATHLSNHALGLISLAAAERGLRVATAIWQSPPGTLILYGTFTAHVALAFASLYQRRTLRIPPLELLRIAAGFGIPTLLIGHAISTRLAFQVYGHPPDYAHVVWTLWHSGREGRQIALLVPGWLHGCLGLRYAFGRRAWFRRLHLVLFAGALLLPVLAVTGFLSMVRDVAVLARDPAWLAPTMAAVGDAERRSLAHVGQVALAAYFGMVGAALVARLARSAVERGRGRQIAIGYPHQTVRVPRGWTVLEASRSHRVAHLSMCGGNARCSTCRVQVVDGLDRCPPPSRIERATLARIGAPDDTRLACQLRPHGDVRVVPLLTALPEAPRDAPNRSVERDVTVMVVDLRRRAAPRALLPHDALYTLERYSETVGTTVRAWHGLPGPLAGDRVVVLFGMDCGAQEANRQALRAAAELDGRLQALRTSLMTEVGDSTEHAIALHSGIATIGEVGDRAHRTPIAVGAPIDAVVQLATASRASASPWSSRIVASRRVVMAARRDAGAGPWTRFALAQGGHIEFTRLDAARATGITTR